MGRVRISRPWGAVLLTAVGMPDPLAGKTHLCCLCITSWPCRCCFWLPETSPCADKLYAGGKLADISPMPLELAACSTVAGSAKFP